MKNAFFEHIFNFETYASRPEIIFERMLRVPKITLFPMGNRTLHVWFKKKDITIDTTF